MQLKLLSQVDFVLGYTGLLTLLLLPLFYTLLICKNTIHFSFSYFCLVLFFFNLSVFHYEMDVKRFVNELWRIWWDGYGWRRGACIVYVYTIAKDQRVMCVIYINFCKINSSLFKKFLLWVYAMMLVTLLKNLIVFNYFNFIHVIWKIQLKNTFS